MKIYESTVAVSAEPDNVWSVITDGQNYAGWNNCIERIEGTIERGSKVKVFSKKASSRGRALQVTILEYVPSQKLSWRGVILPLGLLQAVHTFTLSRIDQGQTEVTVTGEVFGLLSSAIGRNVPDFAENCRKTTAGLKAAAEAKVSREREAIS